MIVVVDVGDDTGDDVVEELAVRTALDAFHELQPLHSELREAHGP